MAAVPRRERSIFAIFILTLLFLSRSSSSCSAPGFAAVAGATRWKYSALMFKGGKRERLLPRRSRIFIWSSAGKREIESFCAFFFSQLLFVLFEEKKPLNKSAQLRRRLISQSDYGFPVSTHFKGVVFPNRSSFHWDEASFSGIVNSHRHIRAPRLELRHSRLCCRSGDGARRVAGKQRRPLTFRRCCWVMNKPGKSAA